MKLVAQPIQMGESILLLTSNRINTQKMTRMLTIPEVIPEALRAVPVNGFNAPYPIAVIKMLLLVL